jgi:hypothetical protein
METIGRIVMRSVLLGLAVLAAGCVVAPAEGYYDRDHHRYWHDHAWHDCVEHDDHCR